jgi:pimeloyl-ACP methyl ester carboxylesterase
MDREKKDLTPETRLGLPGQFISLADGVTHYQTFGPETGQVVVLVHGFSIPAYLWEQNVTALAQAGFRVITFDLYGRGTSDRTATEYTLDLFVRQIDNLLDGLKISRPVDIGGLSMGAYVAAAYANRHPDRVRRVILFAPQAAPMDHDPSMGPVTLPGVGEYLFATYIAPVYLAGDQSEFANPAHAAGWSERYRDAMQYRGFRAALLSTLRTLKGDPLEEYRQLGHSGRAVLLVWGQEDQTVPLKNAALLQAAIPQAELRAIPNARHLACYEFADQVNPILVEFLKR